MRQIACLLLLLVLRLPAATNGYGVLPGNDTPRGTIATQLGVRYLRVSYEWSIAEPQRGQLGFANAQDITITTAENAGLKAVPTIYIGRANWITGRSDPPNARVAKSFPPLDLLQSPNPTFAYSETYYNFVFNLLTHYRGHFDWIAIESDPDLTLSWGGTADQYVRLVKTAYKAAKAADANVKVTDGGISSSLWGMSVAKDWITNGPKTREQALQWALDYYTLDQPAGAIGGVNSTDDIAQILDDPNSTFNAVQYPKLNTILDGISGSVDGVNLHFYQHAGSVETVADWIRSRTRRSPSPYTPPLLTNEIGTRTTADSGCSPVPSFTTFEAERQARWTFRDMVSARAAGLEPVIWYSVDTVCDATRPGDNFNASLFNPDPDNLLRSSGRTFQYVVKTLGAQHYSLNKVLQAGPTTWAYQFNNAEGKPSLAAAWTTDGQTHAVTIPSAGYLRVNIYDYTGAGLGQFTTISDTIQINVSDPVFIVFTSEIPRPITTVNAASYAGGQVTADGIFSAYGNNLATTTEGATDANALPTTLGGTTAKVRDFAGVERFAQLLYVSPGQVNFILPKDTVNGQATLTITGGDGFVSTGQLSVIDFAPGLFSKNSDGKGVAAANLIRVRGTTQTVEEVAKYDQLSGKWVPLPIDLGPETDKVFLVLYGTGIRNGSALVDRATVGGVTLPVSYAGPQKEFAGLDQVNVELIRALQGSGEVDVVLTDTRANAVLVSIR